MRRKRICERPGGESYYGKPKKRKYCGSKRSLPFSSRICGTRELEAR